ncbi:MAG TPA: NAD-dependent epimerase/dehydratase family protein [Chloroflexi bacterium]|nr:MAG: epimerase [Chloroflexota bacterium]HDN04669.1 NAD-dependent epimerase/dehydratase family protein [Chloroflexota bacterium]
MKILVTGVAGFLGSALAQRLLEDGHKVLGLDDLSTGKEEVIPAGVEFELGDMLDRPKLWTLLQDVECVYHLAAKVAVQESILYPREYNSTNVGGTVSVMEAMRDVGVKRVVFTSSGAIYGAQKAQPLHELMVPSPDSPYAVSKLSAEFYVKTIGKLWGIETVTLRIFNAYGPGQHLPADHPPVIPNFLKQAVKGGSLIVHNSGSQTRDFVYLDDVVNALTRAGTASGVDGATINIGSGKEYSVLDLVNNVVELTGADTETIYNHKATGGVSRMRADITRASKLLGYKPKFSLAEGLARTLELDHRFKKGN